MTAWYGRDDTTADVVGVGFGPANLALAIALAERPDTTRPPLRTRFLERQAEFGWHRGMLIDGATMQVSFLKDLATPRCPTSPFGFLAYLHAAGRLAEFINRKSFFPFRTEFHAYLSWAAAQFAEDVSYGSEVVALRPAPDGDHLDVDFRCGATERTQRTRSVVLATGLVPRLPDGVPTGDRIWHSSELLHRVPGLTERGEPRCLVVVGAGQSAAEVTAHLHDRFPAAAVHAVFARYGYGIADNSPFANQIFDPEAVDRIHAAPAEVRDMLAGYHANTNYSVVDAELIEELYDRAYREGISGRRRLHVHGASRVRGYEPLADTVRVHVEDLTSGAVATLAADAVVLATGYTTGVAEPLLGEVGLLCPRDAHGRLQVTRDHRVVTDPALRAAVYLQGPTEHTHGIASTLLSNVAVRAGEIADQLTRLPVGLTPGDVVGAGPAAALPVR